MDLELTESSTTEVYVLGRWIQSYVSNASTGYEEFPDGAPWLWLDSTHDGQHTTYKDAKWAADERNKDVSLTSPYEVYHIRTATTVSKVTE